MEEPENGVHPERIPAMIQLLRDLTTDTEEQQSSAGGEHLRQVIINTHSPAVVLQVPEDSLVMAESIEINQAGASFKAAQLRCLKGTWRERAGAEPVAIGRLLAYLNPIAAPPESDWSDSVPSVPYSRRARRVIDREDVNQYKIPFAEIAE